MERTEDGRYVVIDGRRWRATDPLIPDDVAAVLRRELMAARREVGAALRAQDPVAERAARDRVQAAKTALGERGTPWWEQTLEERRARWEAGRFVDEREAVDDADAEVPRLPTVDTWLEH